MKKVSSFLSWLGILLILGAYVLNNFGLLNSFDFLYIFLNLVGSILIIFHALDRRDYQPVILNIIWALVAIISLIKIGF